jgi:hypothetical protein
VIARRRRGVVRVLFDPAESRQLVDLLTSVSRLIGDGQPDDTARARLLPDGYRDDPGAAEQFREMTEGGLIEAKRSALAECIDELAATASDDDQPGTDQPDNDRPGIRLDGPGLQRWLQCLNDVRLTLGTRLDDLGVDLADGDLPEDDALGAEADVPLTAVQGLWLLYRWLTYVQDELVELAMSG